MDACFLSPRDLCFAILRVRVIDSAAGGMLQDDAHWESVMLPQNKLLSVCASVEYILFESVAGCAGSVRCKMVLLLDR